MPRDPNNGPFEDVMGLDGFPVPNLWCLNMLVPMRRSPRKNCNLWKGLKLPVSYEVEKTNAWMNLKNG